jgi:multidrug efflux pump subunit AcrB
MSVSLLTSLVLALSWTTNLGSRLIRRNRALEAAVRRSDENAEGKFAAAESRGTRAARIRALRSRAGRNSADDGGRRSVASGGIFERILNFYETLAAPRAGASRVAAGFCAILIVVSYFCYTHLGSDLLPAMDEGGFVLDYVMPPGSSLQETNRVISHVEPSCAKPPKWRARRGAPVCNWGWRP